MQTITSAAETTAFAAAFSSDYTADQYIIESGVSHDIYASQPSIYTQL